jgi:hypothetical protein
MVLLPERPHLVLFLGAGALIAVAFLMRDVIAFVAIGFVPLAVGAAMRERSWASRLIAFVLVFAPLIVTQRAYCEWNRERVGAPIVTTISQRTLLDALGGALRYDPAIFAGSGTLDKVGRRVFTSFGVQAELDEANEANAILHRDFGWSAVRIAHEASTAYLAAWIHYPAAMVRCALSHLTETQLHQAVRPIETLRDVLLWNTGSDRDFARDRAVRGGELVDDSGCGGSPARRSGFDRNICGFHRRYAAAAGSRWLDRWRNRIVGAVVGLPDFFRGLRRRPSGAALSCPGRARLHCRRRGKHRLARRGHPRPFVRPGCAGTARRSLTPAAGKRRRADASLN